MEMILYSLPAGLVGSILIIIVGCLLYSIIYRRDRKPTVDCFPKPTYQLLAFDITDFNNNGGELIARDGYEVEWLNKYGAGKYSISYTRWNKWRTQRTIIEVSRKGEYIIGKKHPYDLIIKRKI